MNGPCLLNALAFILINRLHLRYSPQDQIVTTENFLLVYSSCARYMLQVTEKGNLHFKHSMGLTEHFISRVGERKTPRGRSNNGRTQP